MFGQLIFFNGLLVEPASILNGLSIFCVNFFFIFDALYLDFSNSFISSEMIKLG